MAWGALDLPDRLALTGWLVGRGCGKGLWALPCRECEAAGNGSGMEEAEELWGGLQWDGEVFERIWWK